MTTTTDTPRHVRRAFNLMATLADIGYSNADGHSAQVCYLNGCITAPICWTWLGLMREVQQPCTTAHGLSDVWYIVAHIDGRKVMMMV